MKKSTQITNKIKEVLEGLVRAGTIGELHVRPVDESIFNLNLGKFPVAVLPPPYILSEIETNVDNIRTYNYEILIILKTDSITPDEPLTELMETLIDTFDNMPSLEGVAEGGVEPSTAPTSSVSDRGKNYTVFRVILKARACATITL